MVIGAQQSDFSSIIDSAPPSFSIFYWYGSIPKNRSAATITKLRDGYQYRLSSNNQEEVAHDFDSKPSLIAKMETDNEHFNRGNKVTIEF